MDLHHPILREFPQYRETIKRLKAGSDQFRRFFEEYHTLDEAIYRIEEEIEFATDQETEELKKRRAWLKDQIYHAVIQAFPQGNIPSARVSVTPSLTGKRPARRLAAAPSFSQSTFIDTPLLTSDGQVLPFKMPELRCRQLTARHWFLLVRSLSIGSLRTLGLVSACLIHCHTLGSMAGAKACQVLASDRTVLNVFGLIAVL